MKVPLLFLRFESYLQSWGENSKWDYRDTSSSPTKSGIIGLIACAMGLKRNHPEILNLNDNLKIGIRIEKSGTLLRDYHTIMPLDKGDQIPTAEGKNKKGAIVSERYYLQNAFFLIIISGEEKELTCIKEALLNPKWVTYLGRKSCVPTKPVYKEISFDYESLEEALKKYPLERKKDEKMFYLCEIEDVNGDYSRNDISLNNKSRDYRERKIKRFNVEL